MGKSISLAQRQRMFEQAGRIWRLVQVAGNRAMAADGPVSPEWSELDEDEYRDMLRHARAIIEQSTAADAVPKITKRRRLK